MLRIALSAWLIIATNLSSVTIVHSHQDGETAHRHFGHQADRLVSAACSQRDCFTSNERHAHIWLFGMELHVPIPPEDAAPLDALTCTGSFRGAAECCDMCVASEHVPSTLVAMVNVFDTCVAPIAPPAVDHPATWNPPTVRQRLSYLQTLRL